ncbi:heat shock protein 60 family co-chaperone GroES [Vibrio sp. JCM 19053]|nr:heat shock protein 60 family co-chaperone GroES [Vibrio sp. JCM 19053]
MKIRPLNDKLIVERQEVENKSEGGIVLTSQSVKKIKPRESHCCWFR